MASYDFDLFVIGAGSGGVRAARMSAGLGAKTAVAEERYLGGTCVNVGCVPKKLFVYASHVPDEVHEGAGYGWSVEGLKFDWRVLIDNKNKEIERLNGIYAKLLANAGVTLIEARAKVIDAHTVEAGGKRYTAERILIATGGWPSVPDIPGKEHIFTSNEVFYLDEAPKRALIVGGGYIAVEFAGIFNGLGAETIQLYRGDLFLRGFDQDVRETLAEEMRKKGVDLRFNANVAALEKRETGILATLEDGSVIEVDVVLYATGRHPNTANLGLEETGVALAKNHAIIVNEDFQTSVPSIYALGDVIDRVALTPVAIGEGMVFSHNTYNAEARKMDYRDIPTAVFSQPSVGTVGLTEAEAREKFAAIDVYKSSFRAMKHTLSGSQERVFYKLIVDKASDRVVGFHMLGPDAGEVTQAIGVAFKAGATKADFDQTIGIHPTSAEEFVTMRTPEP